MPYALIALLLTQTPGDAVFRTGTQLATVRFHVVKDKRYVDSLRPEDLVLTVDGTPQPITFFQGGRAKRTMPIEIMLLFDVSGSVQHDALFEPLTYEKALLRTSENVRVSVYGFAAKLFRFCQPTRDAAELTGAFRQVAAFGPGKRPRAIPLELPPGRKQAQGASWIYEAVSALARMDQAPASRMILVFSDGFQTTDARAEDAAAAANEQGVSVYPVAVGHRQILERLRTAKGQMQRARLEAKERDIQEFAGLGEATGGRSFEPFQLDTQAVDLILRYLAAQAIYEYVAGFSPPTGDKPRKHKLELRLAAKETGKLLSVSRTVTY